jgi:hypothetical protein
MACYIYAMSKETIGQVEIVDGPPVDIAEHIVAGNGLPRALSSKPDCVFDSPEVALQLSEEQRLDLLDRLNDADDNGLDVLNEALSLFMRTGNS